MQVMDKHGKEIGTIKRLWLSKMRSPLDFWRRRYELSVEGTIIATVYARIWANELDFIDMQSQIIGGVHRRQVTADGLSKKITNAVTNVFTDSSSYLVHMDSTGTRALSLDERSVFLGFAVTLDQDFFSDHSWIG